MSSSEPEYDNNEESESVEKGTKKRRIQSEYPVDPASALRNRKACDTCKRKKIRCNGSNTSGNKCSNCITHNIECTYVDPGKKRGHAEPSFKSLGTRLDKMENVLQQLFPNSDTVPKDKAGNNKLGSMENRLKRVERALQRYVLPESDPSHDSEIITNIVQGQDSFSSGQYTPQVTPSPRTQTPPYTEPSSSASIPKVFSLDLDGEDNKDSVLDKDPSSLGVLDEDDDIHNRMIDDLKRLQVDPAELRFYGKSSNAQLVREAVDLKQVYTGQETDIDGVVLGRRRPEFWTGPADKGPAMKRWSFISEWENNITKVYHPNYVYPPPDLLHSLIDLYFRYVNAHLPLLHRPTFEKAVAEGLHLRAQNHETDGDDEAMFGAVLLLVCAVASRYSNDERVLFNPTQNTSEDKSGKKNWHSSGWKYFNQVQAMRKSILASPTLHDLQFYALSALFFQGSHSPHNCWARIGIGIRMAQDIGVHRMRKSRTVEDELLKRAFWVLVCLDRTLSAGLGRSCAIQDEDYDLDFPLEADDEYWEHPNPEMMFRQPPGKPSRIAAFNLTLKLTRIMGRALRTIYVISKWRFGYNAYPRWEAQVVADLDSALNKWIDSVPEHLRWNTNQQDLVFFNQSAVMYTYYYAVRILIHQPYFRRQHLGQTSNTLTFPSIAICATAARSCVRVVEAYRKRNVQGVMFPHAVFSQFTSGIILLLNAWMTRRSSTKQATCTGSKDQDPDMEDVYKCMSVLNAYGDRWMSPGRLYDVLYHLMATDPGLSPTVDGINHALSSSFSTSLPDPSLQPASSADYPFMETFMDIFGPEFVFDYGDSFMSALQGHDADMTSNPVEPSSEPAQPTTISPQSLLLPSANMHSVQQLMCGHEGPGTVAPVQDLDSVFPLAGAGMAMQDLDNEASLFGFGSGSHFTEPDRGNRFESFGNAQVATSSLQSGAHGYRQDTADHVFDSSYR